MAYPNPIQSSTSAILKTIYDKEGIADACYPMQTLLKNMKKVETGGKTYNQLVRHARIGGGGPVFTTAQTNSQAMVDKEFVVTKAYYYLPWTISRELMAASKGGGEKAYVDGLKDAIADGLRSAGCDLEQQLWRNGTGSIGQISATSNVATDTITLMNIEDIVHFTVGDKLCASTADGGVLRTGTGAVGGGAYGVVTIKSIDRDLGTITASGAWSATITQPVAATDYLYREGCAANTGANVCISGVAAWIPPVLAAGNKTLFGVDRSVDSSRLAGTRVNASGLAVDDAILNLAQRMAREGCTGDFQMFISPNRYNSLAKSVRQNQYFMNNSKAEVGFASIKFPTPAGVWEVEPATFCPDAYGWALDMATWKILDYGGGVPEIVQDDGNVLFRSASSDAFEVRIASYLQLCCHNPSRNGVVTF
jgi:hypothetical protein